MRQPTTFARVEVIPSDEGALLLHRDRRNRIRRKEWVLMNGSTEQTHWLAHREDGPAIMEYDVFGRLVREQWARNGQPYRGEDLPYSTTWYPGGTHIKSQQWMSPRVDGPILVNFNRSGEPISEMWRLDKGASVPQGLKHKRENRSLLATERGAPGKDKSYTSRFPGGPEGNHSEILDSERRSPRDLAGSDFSKTTYSYDLVDPEGNLILQQYGLVERLPGHVKKGPLHREDGPAYVGYYSDGSIHVRKWALHGLPHREDGPCEEEFALDGTVLMEKWALHGLPHREDGPAITQYRSNGSVRHESWYRCGLGHRVGAPSYLTYDEDGRLVIAKRLEAGVVPLSDIVPSSQIWDEGIRIDVWHREDGSILDIRSPEATPISVDLASHENNHPNTLGPGITFLGQGMRERAHLRPAPVGWARPKLSGEQWEKMSWDDMLEFRKEEGLVLT